LPDLLHATSKRLAIGPAVAAVVYGAVAVVFTWPLAAGLARDIPWDLGDSLLNAWILAWDADRLLRFFSGDLGALRTFWNANIFYPEPLTLAYSEHLFAQAVQILPVYALTGNIILSYNLLFLSTFVLSGLGMFLLVRELTGSARAGLAAGLIYAFAPYRVPQFSHLQVLSSQWMPFVLYGLRRYFTRITRRPNATSWARLRPLAGAGVALVAQNLSNGYFLLFFAPFVVAYVLFEIAARNLWKNARMWVALSATAAFVTAATLPFLVPYLELRSTGLGPRSLNEVRSFSADVFSYLTSPPQSHLWGAFFRGYPKPEGELFLTLAALVLAAAGIASSLRAAWTGARATPPPSPKLMPVVYLLLVTAAVAALALGLVFTGNGFTSLGPLAVSVRTVWPTLRALALVLVLLAVVSPPARAFARSWSTSPVAFAALAGIAAFLLSLGPEMRTEGRLIADVGPYSFLYWNVPGFDGLRVPARYAMLVVLFLAIVAGHGAAAIERRHRFGGAIAMLVATLAVAEAFAAPIPLNGTVEEVRYATPPPRVHPADRAPAVYRFLETLPAPGTVVVEFPFGEWAYELRYVFYSTVHWHPLLNGYSGHFPMSYNLNAVHFRRPLDSRERSWEALTKSGATHAIVHSNYYRDDEGDKIARWLAQNGARQVADFDGDRVFALR
jgi:hypothetical protein